MTIKLSKPNALALAASAQVQITRQRDDFSEIFSRGPSSTPGSSSLHSVALAFGSNLGDRFANIETALRLLEVPTSLLGDLPKDAQVSVVDTSFMYETAPMYVTDQPRFANCACMVCHYFNVVLIHVDRPFARLKRTCLPGTCSGWSRRSKLSSEGYRACALARGRSMSTFSHMTINGSTRAL